LPWSPWHSPPFEAGFPIQLEIGTVPTRIPYRMSYQVIARKYRPQRFSDVVGQDHVTRTLANAIQQNRIAHAYLFVGPRGTGKTTLARIFAKCLNCTSGPNVDFAEDDPRCQEIAEGRSLDVLEIDGASNRGIEEIRELRETVKYAPATSRFKIYIIDEVHMLTKEAFNALLKTLEEPPAHVKFMFATTEPEKVLPTILSRCQRFDLRRIPTALIVQHLGQIARLEGVQIQEAALFAIARGADGGMRDAESALDQLISFCGNAIVEADVLSMFGLAAQGQILRLVEMILARDAPGALRELDDLARNGKDLGRLLGDLLSHFRNLLLFQISQGDLSRLEVSENEARVLAAHAQSISVDALTRILDLLSEFEARLKEAVSKRILMELVLLKCVQARDAVSLDSVLQNLRALRAGTGATEPPRAPLMSGARAPLGTPARPSPSPVPPAPAAPPQPPPRPTEPAPPQSSAPPLARPAANSPLASADLTELWGRILESVGRVSQFTRTYLLEAHPVSLVKNVLTIGFDPAVSDHLGLVDNAKTRTVLQTKLHELGYPESHVRFIEAAAPESWARPVPPPQAPSTPAPEESSTAPSPAPPKAEKPPAAAPPAGKEDFKNDPLIKQALEIFKGQIIEVRS
jgi:DNA polymerase-3 subunit gamma/tau